MILPTKHISQSASLLGVGALLLKHLQEPRTLTGLWDHVRSYREVGSYARFILALDLLFLLGAVELDQGLIRRCTP